MRVKEIVHAVCDVGRHLFWREVIRDPAEP